MLNHKRLKQLRELRELTVFELAVELCNAGRARSLPTIRAWEAGRIQPRVDDFVTLARVLNVSLDELVVEGEALAL